METVGRSRKNRQKRKYDLSDLGFDPVTLRSKWDVADLPTPEKVKAGQLMSQRGTWEGHFCLKDGQKRDIFFYLFGSQIYK